jgi:flagellar hook-associated protein 2
MSSLSSSIYGSQTNKGVGGLLSGLDTDDLVKQMTAATRNKINRQYQAKQKLLYKQEAYREISQKLLSFSDKYFSYSSGSKTNILSPSFFEANTFKSSSNYVSVTGNADSISNFQINSISKVAKASTYTTGQVSSPSFSSDVIPSYMSSLAGDTMTIEYEGKKYNLSFGKDFKYTGDTLENQVNDVVDELNIQLGAIKDANGNNLSDSITYKVENGEIKFANGTAKLVAASTDILKVLNIDNIEPDTVASSSPGNAVNQESLIRTAEDVFLSSSITFDFNGVKKTIDLSRMAEDTTRYTYDAIGLKNYLNDELVNAYGPDKVTVDELNSSLTFSVVGAETNVFEVSSISSDLSILTGINSGDSNRLNMSKPIGDLYGESTDYSVNINGKQIDGINSSMSISEILKKINTESDVNVTYSTTTDKFVINSKESGAHTKIEISGGLSSVLFGGEILEQNGTDTVMNCTINGQDTIITRSTANFSIDGINIELNKNAEGITTPITFDVTNNSDEVVERVKQFINDYNEIITLIGSQTKEKPNRNYLPLTPEQQDEMEEKEIENWNKEAKKGVLFGDSNMNSVMNNLRFSMTGLTSVSSLTLANIGIASASMDTSGKLVLDEKKFKEKLLENPDEIANLFTQSTTEENGKSGIAIEIQKTLRENIGAFGTSGILIEEAGLESGLKSDQNNISLKMKEYDDKMKELKKDLEKERERYWSKFSALESALNNLNAQSSWLTDMMG